MPDTTLSALEPEPAAAASTTGASAKPTGHDLLFPSLPYTIKKRAHEATRDIQLQQFVNYATYKKDQTRKQQMGEWFGDRADAMRELGGQIKQHTLDHLDYYLEQFEKNATAAGAQVHFAKDGKQANEIAVAIAKAHDCKLCVKSKSMVTEETHLLPALEAIGCETIETDLGEFILQIDHDAPSHIVTPMIHKDRKAVGRAYERELGVPYTEDPEELTMIARRLLREKYRQADLGISGGNFLIAETGTLVICSNEGNGRFCTSAPKVHIAFVGIEKLLPRMEDLSVLLKLLARSSTGQPMTCYTSHLTGPRRRGGGGGAPSAVHLGPGECAISGGDNDGPEHLHVILVDNGRTEALKAETREMLRCIRCGACLNACPVYRKVGGHSYGSVYSGPIGAILTPVLKGLENYPDLPHASSLCEACYEACPVKINIPKYLIQLRKDLVKRDITSLGERVIMRSWAASLRTSLTYRLGGWGQKTVFRSLARLKGTMPPRAGGGDGYTRRGWVNKMPGAVGGWTKERDMPTPPAKSFRQWWRDRDV